jgi:hypothetical protein
MVVALRHAAAGAGVLLAGAVLLGTALLRPSAGSGQVPAPPGACVAIPSPTFHVHRTTTQSSPPDPAYPYQREATLGFGTTRAVDVDGDGTLDVLVPEPAPGDCVGSMHVAVYLVRGACGHRLGVIQGRVDPAASSTHRIRGLFDLVTTVDETVQDDPRVPARRRTHRRTYRFDGAAYRELTHTTSDAVCHHCVREACTTTLAPRECGPE